MTHIPSMSPAAVRGLLRSAWRLARLRREPEARATFAVAGEHDASPRARQQFGWYLFRRGELAEAFEQFSRALVLAQQQQRAPQISAACHHLAAVCRAMGCPDAAARLQQRSLRAAADADDPADLGAELSGLGNDALLAGRLDLAEDLFRRALACERFAEAAGAQAHDWGSLGVVAQLQRAWQRSLGCFGNAIRLHRAARDRIGLATDLLNVAETLRHLGRVEEAERALRRSR